MCSGRHRELPCSHLAVWLIQHIPDDAPRGVGIRVDLVHQVLVPLCGHEIANQHQIGMSSQATQLTAYAPSVQGPSGRGEVVMPEASLHDSHRVPLRCVVDEGVVGVEVVVCKQIANVGVEGMGPVVDTCRSLG